MREVGVLSLPNTAGGVVRSYREIRPIESEERDISLVESKCLVYIASFSSPPSTMPAPVLQPRTLYDKIWDDHVMFVVTELSPWSPSLTVSTEIPRRMD